VANDVDFANFWYALQIVAPAKLDGHERFQWLFLDVQSGQAITDATSLRALEN
jgi:hypothetical protein